MTAKTRMFSRNQSWRSRGAIDVATHTAAYHTTRAWSSRWSRKRVRMWVVEVEITPLPWVQDLINPCLEIDDVRPRRAIRCPRERRPQRRLQVHQLEPSLRACIGRARRRRREAREGRKPGWEGRYQRRADESLHLIDERALQVAAILVDPHRPAGEFGERAASHIAEQIRDRIRLRLRRRLLGEPRQPRVLEEQVQDRGLPSPHPLHEPGGLDAAQNLRIEEE